jgi:D-glycero-D-manno-heptose 1,7-bisphosphate phosphatase
MTQSSMNKAIFLDRDGVINEDLGYVSSIKDFVFKRGIFKTLLAAQKMGYKLFVITNQSGIGRGFFTEDDYRKLTDWMIGEFKRRGITITDCMHSPYHPEEGLGIYKKNHITRKPNPGMINLLSRKYSIDISSSFLIGDKLSDIEAGNKANIRTNFLIDNKIQINPIKCKSLKFIQISHICEVIKFFK